MSDYLQVLYEIEKEYYINLPNATRECNYKGHRYKDTLLNYIIINIDRVVDFTDCETTQGVYMIDELYIGKSIHIKRRIAEHLEESLFDISKMQPSSWLPIKSGNINKVKRIRECLNKGKLKIKLLSENMKEETKIIREGYLKYNLTNRTTQAT